MSTANYYDNPFENDDDDTCFATIELDDEDEEYNTSHTGFSSRKISSHAHRSRGPSIKQPRSSTTSNHRRSLHFVEEVEQSPSVQLGSGSGNRGRPVVSSASRAANQNAPNVDASIKEMQDSYENMVRSLHSQLSSLQAENETLHRENSELESLLRAAKLEGENTEFLLRQEASRSALLEEKVNQLERELESLRAAPRSSNSISDRLTVNRTPYSEERPPATRSKPLPPSPAEMPPPRAAPIPHSQYTDPNAVVEEETPPRTGLLRRRPPPPLQTREEETPIVRGRGGGRANESHFNIFQQNYEDDDQESLSGSRRRPQKRRTLDNASADRADPNEEFANVRSSSSLPPSQLSAPSAVFGGNTNDFARGAKANAELTEKQKEEDYNRHMADIEALEADLLHHSMVRDELQGTLQRLDSSRARSVADRAKKAATERSLEAEEKIIGHIRLQIRNLGR